MSIVQDDVVIAGIGGIFPSCDNIDELKEKLLNHVDMVQESPDPHWKAGAKLDVPNRLGKVKTVSKFDANFFGIHRKQCNPMDPMTRLMLERSFEAIVDAGVNPADLRGSNMGVFMGSFISESENSWMFVDTENGFGILGHNRSMLANRVSYWLSTHGPSYAYFGQHTCGIQGLTMAYQAIKEGRCDSALVGTANLATHPELSWHLKQLGILSVDGKCRSFDADANGMARSESVVAMYIQRSSDAKRVYASIVHSDYSFYGNHEGKFTDCKSPVSLTHLLTNFYSTCGVDPKDVCYFEADGSGRKDGDELELNVVDKIMTRNRKEPLLIGSVKSNLGHTEASSNLVSVAKVAIAMQYGTIPANLHFQKPSPRVPALSEGRMKVVTENTPLPGDLVAINSFGITGEYAHILLKACNKVKKPVTDELPRLVVASSRNEAGLEELLTKVEEMQFDPEYVRLLQNVYSVNTPNYIYRGYTVLNFAPEEEKKREMQRFDGAKRPVWFVFSGMGSQWPGMGTQLLKIPIFAETIEKCHNILKPKGIDLKHIITSTDPTIFHNILHSFVGIAAIQLGLVDILFAMGLEPDGIIGHSVGELGCAYADGCFTLEQMILSAYSRGLASIETKLIKGTMAAVGLGYQQVKSLCPPGIEVACHNSSDSSTISGPAEQMTEFVASLQANGVFARSVNVSNIAYHSQYIAPAAPILLKYLKEVIPDPKPRSKRWISTSVPENKWDTTAAQYSSAEYHTNNLLGSVLFEEGSAYLPKNAIVIEIAPHGLLQAILRRSLGTDCTNISLTHRGQKKAVEFLLCGVGKLYLAGLSPKVDRLYPEVEFPVSRGTPSISPLIFWEHSDNWQTASEVALVGRIPGEQDIVISLNHEEDRLYSGHVIDGRIFFPISAFLKIVWETLEKIQGSVGNTLPVVFNQVYFHRELVIPERGSVKLYILLQRGSGNFEISSGGELFVSGQITIPEKIEDEFITSSFSELELGEEVLAEEIYRELGHRGYKYSGLFKGIESVKLGVKGCEGKVCWSNNWITFIDSLVQISLLQNTECLQTLQTPVFLQKLVINPKAHTESSTVYNVVSSQAIQAVQCGGVEIRGLRTSPLKNLASTHANLSLEALRFVPHNNNGLKTLPDFLEVSTQLAMENSYSQHLNVIEIEDDQEKLPSFSSVVEDVAKSSSTAWISVRSAPITNGVFSGDERADSTLVITGKKNVQAAESLLQDCQGFLMVCLSPNDTWRPDKTYVLVTEYTEKGFKLLLIKKGVEMDARSSAVVKLSGEESNWAKQIEAVVQGSSAIIRLYIIAERFTKEENTFKEIFRKFDSNKIRFVFLLDNKAPKFTLSDNFYRQQLFQDLKVNVYKDGHWGTFRYHSLGKVNGALSKPGLEYLPKKCLEGLTIHYLGISPEDLSLGNEKTKKDLETLPKFSLGPMEFAGFSPSSHRLMGVSQAEVHSSVLKPDPHLTWQVPDIWSLEEAATVPLSYAMAYYILFMTAKLSKDKKVLIHCGHCVLFHAILQVALENGNTVFTTVNNKKQKISLKKKFPKLQEENIYVMEETNFEVDLLMCTGGKGVQIIINSLQEPHLQSSIRCISNHGYFIQLGKSDTTKNTKIGMSVFLKSTAFYGVAADNLFIMSTENKKKLYALVQEGIKNGTVQPLKGKTFMKHEIDQALRLLGEGHTTEKIVLAVGNESSENTLVSQADGAYKFCCSPEFSYLVVGGKSELCLDVVEWLVARGASKVVIAQVSQTVSSHSAHRINLLRRHHNTHIQLALATKAASPQGANNILQEAVSLGPLAGVFILPNKTTQGRPLSPTCITNIDNASRRIGTITLFASLLYDEGMSLCEARRQAGYPGLAVHWPGHVGEEGCVWRALNVLDGILAKAADSVVYVSESVKVNGPEGNVKIHSDKLSLFLPSSLDDLAELGCDLLDQEFNSLTELASLCPGIGHVREVPILFIVPGLQASWDNEALIIPFAMEVMYPTLCVQLTRLESSITSTAAIFAKHVRAAQSMGPYNLLGASWGGALAMEIARELESQGEKTQVFLLDGAPESTQMLVQQLGTGDQLQVNLITKLLKIPLIEVSEELLALPDWESRVKCAVSKLSTNHNKEHLSAALMATYQRICALLNYQPPEALLQGAIHLIRPTDGGVEHDNCGLDKYFKQTVNVNLVAGDHKGILYNKEAITILNDKMLI